MFEVYGAQQNSGKKQSNIDWDAYHEYIIDTCNLQQREVLPGVITFIADLGVQKQPDAEYAFTGTEEDEAEEIEKNPGTYFKTAPDMQTKKMTRFKCFPQKPIQAVALAVDFPDIQLDYGQFFGDSSGKTKPLRMWLGGTFYQEGTGMIVARPTYLKVNKKLGDWSFDQKSFPYQAAVAAKIIEPGKTFTPQRIAELLGCTLNFTVQVFNKESKGKKYFTEYITFASGLSRGQSPVKYEGKLHVTGFNKENDPDSLKELRNHVKNSMAQASNYKGSKIESQIEHLSNSANRVDEQDEDVEVTVKPKLAAKQAKKVVEVSDDDSPF